MIACRMNGEEDAAVDTLLVYTFTRFRVSRSRNPVARLPRAIGGEVGHNTYIGCCLEIDQICVQKYYVLKEIHS